MDSKEFYRNKRVVVLGLARSGEAAARLLIKLGANVLVSDKKDEEQQREIASRLSSEYPQMEFHLGGHPEGIFSDAELIIVSPGVPYNAPVLENVRSKGIPVIGEMELAYSVCRAPIIAITGTKGKSTTSTLLGQILSKGYKGGNVVVAGNIGTPLSKYVLDLAELDVLVLEISSFQLETTINFRPKVSVILNIMQDHMDRHSSLEEYISAKYRIFANQTENDYTIVNADDPGSYACKFRTQGKVIPFSIFEGTDIGAFIKDGKIAVRIKNDVPVVICDANEVRIPGKHNLQNALAATAVSTIYGIEAGVIKDVLNTFAGLEHALEFVRKINGISFINDTKATNVVSLKAALESINDKIILIIGGRDKGNDYESVIPLVKEKVKHLVIIGESADKIQSALGSFSVPHRAKTLEEAVNIAYEAAESGDSVLLSPACASFDMFRDYAERGRIFKELVRELAGSEGSIS